MTHLTSTEFANWVALYAATGMCCVLAVTLSVIAIGLQLHRERPWQGVSSWRSAALLVPQTWWRWQKLYFLSTPVTLGIVVFFGLSLTWH